MSDLPDAAERRAVREACEKWVAAVAASDLEKLRDLMTDDIIVVHGDGRCLESREAVVADLEEALRTHRVVQDVEPMETIVAGDCAIDRARVRTTVTARGASEPRTISSHTMTVLRKGADTVWRVARVIGVIESGAEG